VSIIQAGDVNHLPAFAGMATRLNIPWCGVSDEDRLPDGALQDEANAAWLENWETQEGVLLSVQFRGLHDHRVEGSAVMVAPGIALCATHVIAPHLDSIMSGESAALCSGITSSGLLLWHVRKVTCVGDSDLTILGLELASALPAGNLFHQGCISTRIPGIGEKVVLLGFRAEESELLGTVAVVVIPAACVRPHPETSRRARDRAAQPEHEVLQAVTEVVGQQCLFRRCDDGGRTLHQRGHAAAGQLEFERVHPVGAGVVTTIAVLVQALGLESVGAGPDRISLPNPARIGAVDKFQGQEAPIVIYSMTTSSYADAPRGMEFLYSLNRPNVATSRAKCICILVASPSVFEVSCRTARQMRLANAFCRYLELAKIPRRLVIP
jgi:hypothetical protein